MLKSYMVYHIYDLKKEKTMDRELYIYILFELFFILNKTTCQVIKRILIILDLIMDKKILFELRKIQVNNL